MARSDQTAVTLPPPQPLAPVTPAAEAAVFNDFATNSGKPAAIRYEYKRGMPTIPPEEAPPIYDRSYLITVEVNRFSTQSDGVLLAMGSPKCGYGMYVQDSHLVFEQTIEGIPQRLVSLKPVPFGSSTLQFRFTRTGPYQGIGTLFINSSMVNSVGFERTLPTAPLEGLDIGLAGAASLSGAYTPPFPFEGTLDRVVFEIDAVG
jgi:arylsulfatase